MKSNKLKYVIISAVVISIFSAGFLGIQAYASYTGNSVKLADKIAGEDLTNDVMKTETRFSYYATSSDAGSTGIKVGSGVLHSITVNNLNVKTPIITLYDNTSAAGTKIATLPASSTQQTYVYDVSFGTGLLINVGTQNGTTGTGMDVTVSYR
jgi:hypothetical protein